MTYRFDRNAQRFGQLSLVVVLLIGYIVNAPAVVLVGAILLASALVAPTWAPQLLLYRTLVRANVLQTAIYDEDPTPHRFAQQVGGSVLAIGTVAWVVGSTSVVWGAVLLVATLALINLITGFCAGCFMYAQIAKLRGGRA